MTVGTRFAHLHTSTSGLSSAVLDKTTEFIYCFRDGVESVCLVTHDRDVLTDVCGTVPNDVYNADTRRYAVDLSTVGTNSVKMYVDSPESGEVLTGYHFSSEGAILQKKTYRRNGDNILLDRYNPNNSVISEGELETICAKSDWGGSSSLADSIESVASEHNFKVIYLKRAASNQSYIRVA
tara:strand:- start:35 stop:577 length:543 start_codon:yes stop_codon:yes gene_type:complete